MKFTFRLTDLAGDGDKIEKISLPDIVAISHNFTTKLGEGVVTREGDHYEMEITSGAEDIDKYLQQRKAEDLFHGVGYSVRKWRHEGDVRIIEDAELRHVALLKQPE